MIEQEVTSPPAAAMTTEAKAGFIIEKELLARVPISRRTAYDWVKSGKLPCIKIKGRKLYHWPSVEAALLRMQSGGVQ